MALILLVADFHAVERHYDWLVDEALAHPWDAIAFAGDLLDQFSSSIPLAAQADTVAEKLAAIPRETSLLVASGNHDHLDGDNLGRAPQWLSSLAAQRPNMIVDAERTQIGGHRVEVVGWGKAPTSNAEFIVCHQPPSGARTAREGEAEDLGDLGLAKHLSEQGGTVLCGHVHVPLAWYDLRSGRRSLNPGTSDPSGTPCHIIVNTDEMTALRVGWPLGPTLIYL